MPTKPKAPGFGRPPAARKKARAPAAAPADLTALAEHLRGTAELLAASLAEVPRAQDFQPLADHLYDFAENTPRLIENMGEWLLRLPRAEDYEPLAAPLREFARVSPALAESLGSVVRTVAPLPELVARLAETAEKLRRLPAAAPASSGPRGEALAPALAEAADRMGAARDAIRAALESLPQDTAYATFAAQLRELATVSPSLMDWLRQVPALSLPLGEAVASLAQAAEELATAERAAREALTRGSRAAGDDV